MEEKKKEEIVNTKQSQQDKKKMSKKKKIILSIAAILLIICIVIAGMLLSFFLSKGEYSKQEKNIDIPIFVYHDIVEEETGPEYMQTTKENFIKQMNGLRDLGYQAISYQDLVAYEKGEKKLPNKVFLLSFDDGGEGNYTRLFPIVKELNLPVAINIIDENMEKPGVLTWDQVREMEASGLVSIYSHGKRHVESHTIPKDQFVKEIEEAHSNIETQLGKQADKVYTYPYGLYEEDKIEALAQKGYAQNLTDNKVNESQTLNLAKLHREYPLNDSVAKILLKTWYRLVRYGS